MYENLFLWKKNIKNYGKLCLEKLFGSFCQEFYKLRVTLRENIENMFDILWNFTRKTKDDIRTDT